MKQIKSFFSFFQSLFNANFKYLEHTDLPTYSKPIVLHWILVRFGYAKSNVRITSNNSSGRIIKYDNKLVVELLILNHFFNNYSVIK